MRLYQKSEEHLDSLEQYGRRNFLLLHGIPEEAGEDTTNIFIENAKSLGVKISRQDISRSHRLGRPSRDGQAKRPIIARFVRYSDRARVYAAKKGFKGQRKLITESLTATRVARLKRAIIRYKSENVWTTDGEIYVKSGDKKTKYVEPYEWPQNSDEF